jgi:hypothetical protein
MIPGLHDSRQECSCIWENLEPDEQHLEEPKAQGLGGMNA